DFNGNCCYIRDNIPNQSIDYKITMDDLGLLVIWQEETEQMGNEIYMCYKDLQKENFLKAALETINLSQDDDQTENSLKEALCPILSSSGELIIAYHNKIIELSTKQLDNGESIENIPSTIRNDLCVLRHIFNPGLELVPDPINFYYPYPNQEVIKQGEEMDISATINNPGDLSLDKIPVCFYDRSPSSSTKELIACVPTSIPAGGHKTITVNWHVPEGVTGTHTIHVEIDPDRDIQKVNEKNTSSKDIQVGLLDPPYLFKVGSPLIMTKRNSYKQQISAINEDLQYIFQLDYDCDKKEWFFANIIQDREGWKFIEDYPNDPISLNKLLEKYKDTQLKFSLNNTRNYKDIGGTPSITPISINVLPQYLPLSPPVFYGESWWGEAPIIIREVNLLTAIQGALKRFGYTCWPNLAQLSLPSEKIAEIKTDITIPYIKIEVTDDATQLTSFEDIIILNEKVWEDTSWINELSLNSSFSNTEAIDSLALILSFNEERWTSSEFNNPLNIEPLRDQEVSSSLSSVCYKLMANPPVSASDVNDLDATELNGNQLLYSIVDPPTGLSYKIKEEDLIIMPSLSKPGEYKIKIKANEKNNETSASTTSFKLIVSDQEDQFPGDQSLNVNMNNIITVKAGESITKDLIDLGLIDCFSTEILVCASPINGYIIDLYTIGKGYYKAWKFDSRDFAPGDYPVTIIATGIIQEGNEIYNIHEVIDFTIRILDDGLGDNGLSTLRRPFFLFPLRNQ
ncbi:MAG: CARDB domain-containing protein, partial [bacterium]